MRALARPDVVKKACIATALSCLASLPRLHLWENRQWPVWYLAAVLLTTGFVLWAFVFAWHSKITGREPFSPSRSPLHWLAATALAIANAFIACLIFDPRLRATAPAEFPKDFCSWTADALVSMSFGRLFLIFAPVAFFGRLLPNHVAVVVLTACFNGFIAVLRTTQLELSIGLILLTLSVRLIGSALAVMLYLRGGVWTILWMTLLTQLRHLPALLHN